ncbi:MAG: hypothetical protein WC582_02650 [Patescibacteria group bacterium]
MEITEERERDKDIAFFGGDDEEESDHSFFIYFCCFALEVITVAVSIIIYFLAVYSRWGNGLEYLVPTFFFFVSQRFIFEDYPKIPKMSET